MPVSRYNRVCESARWADLFSPTRVRQSTCRLPAALSFKPLQEYIALYIVPRRKGLSLPCRHVLGWPGLAATSRLANVPTSLGPKHGALILPVGFRTADQLCSIPMTGIELHFPLRLSLETCQPIRS